MGWQDRDYNAGGGGGGWGGGFLNNPMSIFSWSLSVGNWGGINVRLHFAFLLTFLVVIVSHARGGLAGLSTGLIVCAGMFVAVFWHEMGHRIAAKIMGGVHDDFHLWPLGGLVNPRVKAKPWAFFVAHAGGIVASILLWIGIGGAFWLIMQSSNILFFNPLELFGGMRPIIASPMAILVQLLVSISATSIGLVLINLLPIYILDGGFLLQAILWPFIGLFRATNVSCIVGMIGSGILMLLSLLNGGNVFGALMWFFFLSNNYVRRQQLKSIGPEQLQNALTYGGTYNEMYVPAKKRKGWFKWASRKAAQERAEQAKIDAILAKVHEKGLHSLTWWEKRSLRKATERQRQQDMAENRH